TRPELGGSEALAVIHETVAGAPPLVDLGAEVALARLLSDSRVGGHAHDLSEGGLAVALAEIVIGSGCGARVTMSDASTPHLFGESVARAVLCCRDDEIAGVVERAGDAGIAATVVGRLEGSHLDVAEALRVSVDDLRVPFERTIPDLMR
ncbi:MAG: AIR synthase-related protein, partial [Candidatus Binatia bacterium]